MISSNSSPIVGTLIHEYVGYKLPSGQTAVVGYPRPAHTLPNFPMKYLFGSTICNFLRCGKRRGCWPKCTACMSSKV